MNSPMKGFRVARNVTVPYVAWVDEQPVYVKITTAINVSKPAETRRKLTPEEQAALAGQRRKEPPEVFQGIQYKEDGTEIGPRQFIANSVLASNLRNAYPDDGYVGKVFQIVSRKATGNKDYKLFDVTELDPETGGETEVEQASAGKRK